MSSFREREREREIKRKRGKERKYTPSHTTLTYFSYFLPGGKPITPTGDQSLVNGTTPKDSHSTDDPDTTVVDGAITKHESSQLQAAQQNGTKSPHKSPGTGATGSPALAAKNGTTTVADGSTVNSSTTPISNQVIPGPQSASHVVIVEKKKKKCTCCVIQ
uniref:Uncharacterized protein n=1 Tax=Anopheles culicifacies TaxID=139723 RepID=A0A182MX39_9DIPT